MSKEERNIDVLLKTHEEKINKLREKIQDIYDENVHDEIFLLRYCMSNNETDKAAKSIRAAKEYREKNESWMKDIEKGEEFAPHRETMKKYTCSAFHKNKLDDGKSEFVSKYKFLFHI